MSKLLKGIAIFIVAIIVLAVLGSALGKKDDGSKVGTINSSGSSNSSLSDQVFAVGDVIKKGEYTITVTNPNPNYTTNNEFLKPKAGNKYISMEVTLENTGKEKQSISELLHFYAKDNEGNKGQYAMVGTGSSLNGEVLAGDKLKGNLVYEFPQSAKGIKLYFNPAWISGQSSVISLGF